MPSLTPEEKNKIYEEEKERLDAQEIIKKDKKNKQTGIGCLAIIIIALVIWVSGLFKSEKKPSALSAPAFVELKAEVRFTGTQFIITNKDTFDWTNVELEINSGLIKSGYKLKTPRIVAGQTYTVGALQFAKGDGTRFNPFAIKPQNISVSCATPRGQGFVTLTWQ
jgi:hypothetical protein